MSMNIYNIFAFSSFNILRLLASTIPWSSGFSKPWQPASAHVEELNGRGSSATFNSIPRACGRPALAHRDRTSTMCTKCISMRCALARFTYDPRHIRCLRVCQRASDWWNHARHWFGESHRRFHHIACACVDEKEEFISHSISNSPAKCIISIVVSFAILEPTMGRLATEVFIAEHLILLR